MGLRQSTHIMARSGSCRVNLPYGGRRLRFLLLRLQQKRIVALLELLEGLVHDVLRLADLALSAIPSESIQVFDRESDHIRLLRADIL